MAVVYTVVRGSSGVVRGSSGVVRGRRVQGSSGYRGRRGASGVARVVGVVTGRQGSSAEIGQLLLPSLMLVPLPKSTCSTPAFSGFCAEMQHFL